MKPAPFTYRRPASLAEALVVLAAEPDARLLAGGQSLIPLLNFRLITPPVLVDIGRLTGRLTDLRLDGATLVLGANVTTARIERDPTVAGAAPLLARAAAHVGHPAIRNRSTLGGTCAHADPAAELPAALCALDVEIVLARAGGERRVPAARFFRSYLTTALEAGEMVIEVRVPVAAAGTRHGFAELARRHGDYAYAGTAVSLTLARGELRGVRIGLLGVGPTPVLARRAMEMLEGQAPAGALFEAAARVVREEVDPPGDLHAPASYRREMAGVMTARALADALPEVA